MKHAFQRFIIALLVMMVMCTGVIFADDTGKKAGDSLEERERLIYEAVMGQVERIANGETTNTIIQVPASKVLKKTEYTAKDLGLVALSNSNGITSEARNAFAAKYLSVDLNSILEALALDCPYSLYWWNKSSGGGVSLGYPNYSYQKDYSTGAEKIVISDQSYYQFRMFVGAEYIGSEQFKTNPTKIAAAKKVLTKANQIITNAKGLSDLAKLEYYRDSICELTEYNDDAASDDFPAGYIAPWNMIYVFDNDAKTTVVCEGYAKAFQYLCDHTVFQSKAIYSYLATGVLASSDGSQGPHMWNVVHMDDGRNYLVDVTNVDGNSIGAKNMMLFLKPAYNGDYSDYYIFKTYGSTLVGYFYDDSMYDFRSAAELTLSKTAYVEPEPVIRDIPFVDIADGTWMYNTAKFVYDRKIITGTSATTFSPNDNMTRAQFMVILWRMEGQPSVTYNKPYTDVSSTYFAAKAIQWAKNQGLASGYSDGSFHPNDKMTREQFMAFMYRYAKYKGKDVSIKSTMTYLTCSDASQVTKTFATQVEWGYERGFIAANGVINPKGNITRIQAAAIIERFMKKYNMD